MRTIPAGGNGRRRSVKSVVAEGRKSTKAERAEIVTGDEVGRIEVRKHGPATNVVPASVLIRKPFVFEPQDFALESEQLKEKIISEQVQMRSLSRFLKDPSAAVIYGVGGTDELTAKYFAAYLVQEHIKAMGAKANVRWITLYGDYANPHIRDDIAAPSMLVITNLCPNSTNVKLEKARDIIEFYPDVPRVIVVAGQDPMTFLVTRLFLPINAMAHFPLSLFKQVSVI